MLLTESRALDELYWLMPRQLGGGSAGYRKRTRPAWPNLLRGICHAASRANCRRIAVAAAFHDIGIWTDGTF